MAGVIDKNGVQWEPCNKCGKYIRIEQLGYLCPSDAHKFGLDICVVCVDTGIRSGEFNFEDIRPGLGWLVTESRSA